MNDNLLLRYLSELGSGNWRRFKRAVEAVSDEGEETLFSVEARQLSASAHVDFDFDGNLRWSVCPPTLAWIEQADGIVGLLCGMRSADLLLKLEKAVTQVNAHIERQPQPEGADVIFVHVPSTREGDRLAELAQIGSEHDARDRLARILPTLDSYLMLAQREPMPVGLTTERYDERRAKWIEIEDWLSSPSHSAENGFYRFRDYFTIHHRLKLSNKIVAVPAPIGIYAWLQSANRQIMRYDFAQQMLTVPASAILPPLYARTLVLCSGFLPTFDYGNHIYHDVPPTVAHSLMKRLGQGQLDHERPL